MERFLVVRILAPYQICNQADDPLLYAARGSVLGLPEAQALRAVAAGFAERLPMTVADLSGVPSDAGPKAKMH